MKKIGIRTVFAAVLCFAVSLSAAAAEMLIPVGKVVGLSLSEGSVTIVAFDDTMGSAAKKAGLQIGDEIVSIDGTDIDSAADLHQALAQSDGRVRITVTRDRRQHQLSMEPTITDQGPRLGVYVREGVTGIGTITYYDPESGEFGALGHGVSNARGALARMNTGCIYRASVIDVKPGQVGKPGQLKGSVSSLTPIGHLRTNCRYGVFGSCEGFSGKALPVGEAEEGPAKIMSNVNGDAVETFSVEITRLYDEDDDTGRDMMLRVTDEKLLSTTGGIVAGMSGSPIIQDGELVGAVTHVLVNDPATGYGIFVENMLDAAG